MSQIALVDRTELSQDIARIISPAYEVFASEIALGIAIPQAAAHAGFSAAYGHNLIARQDIRERVAQLIAERKAQGAGSLAWIESQVMMVIRTALHGAEAVGTPAHAEKTGKGKAAKEELVPASEDYQPAMPRDHSRALTALMHLAKLKGYIIEKKQSTNANIDLTKLTRAELGRALDGHLDKLAPGERQRIEAIADGSDDEGTLDAAVTDVELLTDSADAETGEA